MGKKIKNNFEMSAEISEYTYYWTNSRDFV